VQGVVERIRVEGEEVKGRARRSTYLEAIITLIGLPTEPSILQFISSRA
jgi:hypothetical protein